MNRFPENWGAIRPIELAMPAGGSHTVAHARPTFRTWEGVSRSSYGGKHPVDVHGRHAFAELKILADLLEHGWEGGVWIDKRTYRTGYWDEPTTRTLPAIRKELLHRIYREAGIDPEHPSGGWDVYCWRGGEVFFVEAKRRGSTDFLKDIQKEFFAAALRCGLRPEHFALVEWDAQSTSEMPEMEGIDAATVSASEPTQDVPVMTDSRPSLPDLVAAIQLVEDELGFQVMRIDKHVTPRTEGEAANLQSVGRSYAKARETLRRLKKYHQARLDRLERQGSTKPRLRGVVLCTADGTRTGAASEALIAEHLGALPGGDDSFLILEAGEDDFIQVLGSPADGYILEYREGGPDRHYQATEVVTLGQAISAFQGFARGEDDWRNRFAWKPLTF